MEPRSDRFRETARAALVDRQLQQALSGATERFVNLRLAARDDRSDWESLRDRARAIRWEAVNHLDRLLVELEERVRANGGRVCWASDAAAACRYVTEVAERHRVSLAVKSKSMATEEIGLNAALERIGVTPVETDLGEYIIQLAGESPSHFLAPAIHWTGGQVGALFQRALGEPPSADPNVLTKQARRALRSRFLAAGMGITGANFAVAQTGTIVILENEGNARLTTSLPKVHVAVMGIEKVIPRLADLAPLLALLPRSATGQRLSSYVSLLNGARRAGERDGPDEFHLVLLDNGRSRILADPEARESLLCIRCAACLAVCPVYRRAGGHAYGWVYQGPIGAVLTPQLIGAHRAPELPFASSLCGACRDACPVKIDIPRLLVHLRGHVTERVKRPAAPLASAAVKLAAWVMRTPTLYRLAGRAAFWVQRIAGRAGLAALPGMSRWVRARSLPPVADRPLRDLVSGR
jgi:L-lactate dehydrogenase complex protein LldF